MKTCPWDSLHNKIEIKLGEVLQAFRRDSAKREKAYWQT